MLDRFLASSSYLGFFVVLCLAGVGLPLPEEIPIVTAGVLAHEKVIRWWLALPVLVAGVLTGDLLLYGSGYRWGARVTEWRPLRRLLDLERLDQLEDAYRKRGAFIVFAARHVMGLRAAAFVTAGIVRLPLWKFLLADGTAIAYGVPLNFGLAYLFTNHLTAVMAEAHRVERWIALAAVAGGVTWLTASLWRRGHRAVVPVGDQRPR